MDGVPPPVRPRRSAVRRCVAADGRPWPGRAAAAGAGRRVRSRAPASRASGPASVI